MNLSGEQIGPVDFRRPRVFCATHLDHALAGLERDTDGIAVEPTTCAPDAFNSADGLMVLSPGASFEGRWGVG
jgi:aldose 1-epimerase